MRCLKELCRAPVACNVFGYCRQRNLDDRGMTRDECTRRMREHHEWEQEQEDIKMVRHEKP